MKRKAKNEKEALFSEALRDIQIEKFHSDMGQKAIVQREELTGEYIGRANRVLFEAAELIQEGDHQLKIMKYLGSACVHIFQSETLQIIQYANQTLLHQCPELHAGPAAHDLRNAMMGFYGHKPQTKRSGF